MPLALTTARDLFLADRRDGTGRHRALTARSLERYDSALTGFVAWLQATRGRDALRDFSAAAAREYIQARAATGRAPNTLTVECAALREFAAWGLRTHQWTDIDLGEMPAVDRPETEPRALAPAVRDAIMALPLTGSDAVLRALLYYTGCREGEILGLTLLDVTPPHAMPDGTEALGRLRIWGKGRKERTVPIHPALWAVLGPHIENLRAQPREWPVLARVRHGRDGQPWAPWMIQRRVHAWGLAVGAGHIVPHQLRHTFATDVCEATNDVRAVQDLLGHASLATTQHYMHVVDQRRAAAVLSLRTFP